MIFHSVYNIEHNVIDTGLLKQNILYKCYIVGGYLMNCYEKGTKIEKGKIKIVNLFGTWSEMGRQYGALMSNEIKSMYNDGIKKHLIEELGLDIEFIKDQGNRFYDKFPYKFKQLFKGIAETCGLDMEKLIMVNAMQRILSQVNKNSMSTSIAVWGAYAKDSIVYGKNYDNEEWLSELTHNMVFAVYHPSDGSLATLTIGFAGQIYVVNGMNEAGLFLSLNNAMYSGSALWYESRIPVYISLFNFLLDSSSLDEIEAAFQTTKSNFACIVGVADSQSARFYEWPVFEVRKRESHSRHGLAVMSNHFTEKSWGLPRPDDKTSGLTISRRQNLITLANHLKGTIDDTVMMKILDTRYKDLGATMDTTVYQLTVVPEQFKIWLKFPSDSTWESVDVREYLCCK